MFTKKRSASNRKLDRRLPVLHSGFCRQAFLFVKKFRGLSEPMFESQLQ
jgi:hypothetical protein